MRGLTLAVGTPSPGRVERGDRFDLDNEIGTRWQRRPGYGAARRLRTKIADEHIGVLSERVSVGHVGPRQDDVRHICPCGFEAGLNILADLFDLLAHVVFADDIAVFTDGHLPSYNHSSPGALD